jgi:dephospho-CoA kinase
VIVFTQNVFIIGYMMHENNVLLGLAGPAGCGKSLVAKLLLYRYGWPEFSFAEPLKNMVASFLDIPRGALESREYKEKMLHDLGVSPRMIMQTLGTEWGRELIHPDVWVKILSRRVSRKNNPISVISDVRFDNEVDYIRKNNGYLLHIARPGYSYNTSHESERGVSLDMSTGRENIINNDGTVEDLLPQIDAVLRDFELLK